MPRKKKPINHSDLPDYEIEKIARCIWPDILAMYESEEGQQEIAVRRAAMPKMETPKPPSGDKK